MPSPGDDVTPADILARIENSPHAELLHDEDKLERTLIELMVTSGHPVLAEMGRELQQGHISWQDLGTIPAYREVLDAGFATIQRIDLADIAAGLDAQPASAADAPIPGRGEEPEQLYHSLDDEHRRWSGHRAGPGPGG